jgi:hypothetical protein
MGGLVVLVALWGLAITIYWMVVGWRAMRAHENLAEHAREIALSVKTHVALEQNRALTERGPKPPSQD